MLHARPLDLLKDSKMIDEGFREIQKRISGVNYYNDTMEMVEEGLLIELMGYLKQGVLL